MIKNDFGSALITNTTLYQSSMFIANFGKYRENFTAHLFDLCNLVDAVVLRRRLYRLDGDIDAYEAGHEKLPLIDLLHNSSILSKEKISIDAKLAAKHLLKIVGSERAFSRIEVGYSHTIQEMVPGVFNNDPDHVNNLYNSPTGNRRAFMAAAALESVKRAVNAVDDAYQFFRTDSFIEYLRGTGSYQRGAYALRTYLYGHAAWDRRIAFIPDYPRIPFIESISEKIHKTVVDELYEEFSDKLEINADDFLKDQRPISLRIPPLLSILLSRCSSPADIPHKLMELREEYSVLRENLSLLEETLLGADNISERINARAHIESIFNAVSSKFETTRWITFNRLVDFSNDFIAPVVDPVNPKSYKTSLLSKPVGWIRDWWLRRPLTQLFDIADAFYGINDYNKLISKVFGIEISEDDIRKFSECRLKFKSTTNRRSNDG